jgi:hypothetical protein
MLNLCLVHMRNAAQRWFEFDNVGLSPRRRSYHAMASDGTRVFVLGGYSMGARSDKISLIHVFDTSMYFCFVISSSKIEDTEDIKYPEPECNAVNLQNGTAVLDRPAALQITHEQNPGPNGLPLELTGVSTKPRPIPEDDVQASEGSIEYHRKVAAPRSSSEGQVTRLELEQQLSVSLAAQTERDHRIAQLTKELALKCTLLEQAEANAVEAARRAEPEQREHTNDQQLMQASLVEQRDVELVDMQAGLRDMQAKLDELLLSRDQQIGQYEKELANVRAKLEANESELEAVRLRLADAERGWTKSQAEADTLRTQIAARSVDRDEDQVSRRLMERVRAIEAEMVSKRWNEKSIAEMECRNEG